MKSEFTIVVPVFNEEDNIFRLEKELSHYIKTATKKTTVLFVNDGSTDESLALIKTICERHLSFQYITFSSNKGLSAALMAGFDCVTSPIVGYIDADLQTTPKDFELLLTHSDHYELVTGERINRQDSQLKKTSSKIANFVRCLFTNDGVGDTGCPLKIFKTTNAKQMPFFKGYHRFFPAMIQLQNGKVKQVPIHHFPRKAGTSKYGVSKRLIGPLIDCFIYLWIKRKYIRIQVEESTSNNVL